MAVVVPDLVRQRALSNGAAGQQWLDDLPKVITSLEDRWELTLGPVYSGGTAAYVCQVKGAAGNDCVLKVAMALDMDEQKAFDRSIKAHQLAAGRGCALLLQQDAMAPAMLLERLGPNLADARFPIPRILQTVARTLNTFWQPVPRDSGLQTGAVKAQWLADYVSTTWSELNQPCGRKVIDRAIAYCDRRADGFDAANSVLVHGDAHGWNTLDAGDGEFKFVDPEGLLSERAHDLSVPMREYNEPLLEGDTPRLVRQRAEQLGAWCNVDPEAIWEWGFIERVSTGLANVAEFEGDAGLAFLKVAERCV